MQKTVAFLHVLMYLWLHSVALLKAAPLSAQHLLKRMLFMVHVLSLASGH